MLLIFFEVLVNDSLQKPRLYKMLTPLRVIVAKSIASTGPNEIKRKITLISRSSSRKVAPILDDTIIDKDAALTNFGEGLAVKIKTNRARDNTEISVT